MNRVGWLAVALVAGTVVSGCGPAASDLPLPGSGVAGPTYRITGVYDDALNLPQGAPVKVNGVTVGRVVKVTPRDFKARVTMDVRRSAGLRAGSQFRLRSTTALGELFVQVTPATRGQLLRQGSVVGPAEAVNAPTVEDSLASASLLVNGGSLTQVQTIVTEMNRALDGRQGDVRGVLDQASTFLREATATTTQIDQVLHSLASASKLLDARRGTIDAALKQIAPAARVLRRNTGDLVRLLQSTARLSRTSHGVVTRVRSQLMTVLTELGPVLDQLNSLAPVLPGGLDSVQRLAGLLDGAAPTDYLNLRFLIHASGTTGLPGGPSTPIPTLPHIPGLPDLNIPGLGGLTGSDGSTGQSLDLSQLLGGGP